MRGFRPLKKIIFLLLFIFGLSFGGFTLSSRARVLAQQADNKSDLSSNDTSSQFVLIKWGAGAIIGALCGAIGLLYRTLLDAHTKMISMLERESSARLEIAQKMASEFSTVSSHLGEFANKLSEVNRRLDSIYLERRDNQPS